ncbi:MAG: L,D-transpeptidase [Solirubrobacteraceae bacterium]
MSALATLVALLPLVPILAAFVLTAQRPGGAGARSATLSPLSAPTLSVARPAGAAELPPGSGTLVAVVLHPASMRAAPGGRVVHRLGLRTEFGSPEALWVVHATPGWLGVVSPLAGNNRLGWIPRSSASLARVAWELRVSLSARRLTVLEAGRVLQRYQIAIGRPDAPTPTGRFAVTDRLATHDPSSPYGCCILALSAFASHAIQGWSGGYRIAIHSTPEASSIGRAISHGCLRLTLAEGKWLINHIPLGTPTLISN